MSKKNQSTCQSPWEYEEVSVFFYRNRKVALINDDEASGVVSHTERSEYTNAGKVLVRWDATGIVAQVHASLLKAIN
jgi:hypothetical protein